MAHDTFSLLPEVLDPDKAHLPLLLLDIDGVLNAYKHDPKKAPLPAHAYQDLTSYSVSTVGGRAFTFWTSPTLISEINALDASGTVEIAWLTTWQYQANACVSPVLGLPQFPVAADQGGRFSDYYWKPRAASEALTLDRPIIWIDDVENAESVRKEYEESDIPHLLIAPDSRHGLLPGDIAAVKEFIAHHAAS